MVPGLVPEGGQPGQLAVRVGIGRHQDYLAALEQGLHRAFQRFSADLAIYLAGADPYRDDSFGRLSLTKSGLLARDRLVLDHCETRGVPVAVTMAGGYARRTQDTVDIHFQTVAEVARRSSRS